MIAEHKGEVPLVVYLLPFLAGIFCAAHFGIHNRLIPLIISGCLSGIFILLNIYYNKFKLYHQQWVGGLIIHLLLFFIGIITVQQHDDRNYADYFTRHQADRVLVSINTEPTLKGKYWHCSANVMQANSHSNGTITTGKMMLTIMADSLHHLNYGDLLLIPANYTTVAPPLNPASFNYKGYLANQHIYEQSFLFPGQYRVIDSHTGNPIIAYAINLRQRLVQKFKVNIADPNAAAVAATLVLGYKADLSADILQAYVKTGTVHVLSVSGAHVAIVFVLISFLLSSFNGSRRGQWVSAVLSITLIWGYAVLTGFSPAVCRAAVMISMFILGKAGHRYTNTANLLALSAFTLLFYDPLLMMDVGFQLSYLAVLGLIVLQPIIFLWYTFKNKYVSKLWYYISASVAAQVITFPLSAFYFHQFPLYFLVSNLFIIIPSEVILFSGIIGLLVPQWPVVSKVIFTVLEHSILLMNKGLHLIEQQPYSSINKIWFTNYDCALLFIAVMAFFYFMYSRKPWVLYTTLACSLVAVTSVGLQKINARQTQSITFYSVSKHPAILFKQGHKGVLLSDLPPTDLAYQYNIQPNIDSSRVDDLHYASMKDDVDQAHLKKQFSFIQFLNNRLLIYDARLQNINLSPKLAVDYLYITGNPHTPLTIINKSYNYDMLIIDGSNSTQTIKKLVTEAVLLKIKYVVLKRNKALVVASN